MHFATANRNRDMFTRFCTFWTSICILSILSRKAKTKQRLYEATTWFKSSKDINLLAFQYVVSKMNFSIFLNTFIGIIGSLKAKYFSYAEFQ
jgi:hypothetical protein